MHTVQIPMSKPGNHLGLRILGYYLIFFPSLDVLSAYPLVVHCLVNNIYIILTGRDTSKEGKWKFDWVLRVILRLFGSITPIFAVMGMANLIYIITYGGLSGYIVCYFFPAILQLTSIHACEKKFSVLSQSTTTRFQTNKETAMKKKENRTYTDEMTPLNANQKTSGNPSYMTQYSIPILSHPWFVAFMMAVIVMIFGLIMASLFISPDQISCEEN